MADTFFVRKYDGNNMAVQEEKNMLFRAWGKRAIVLALRSNFESKPAICRHSVRRRTSAVERGRGHGEGSVIECVVNAEQGYLPTYFCVVFVSMSNDPPLPPLPNYIPKAIIGRAAHRERNHERSSGCRTDGSDAHECGCDGGKLRPIYASL